MKFTITSKYLGTAGERATRTYWVSSAGGYVYDLTHKPGTSAQACVGLSHYGDTLYCAHPDMLPDIIRRNLALRRRMCQKAGYIV